MINGLEASRNVNEIRAKPVENHGFCNDKTVMFALRREKAMPYGDTPYVRDTLIRNRSQ